MRGITPLLERWLGNLLARQFEGKPAILIRRFLLCSKGREGVQTSANVTLTLLNRASFQGGGQNGDQTASGVSL